MLDRWGIPGLGGWSSDPLWATFYDWVIEHPPVGRLLWRAGLGSDLGELYRATDEISQQPAGARVLDIPCGGGVALRGLRPGQALDYIAADISVAMLDRTMAVAEERRVADQVTTQVADVEQLPFDDDTFDLVVSFTGLHCFPNPARAVAEIVRVLRPGGRLVGSALLTDTVLRARPVFFVGRTAGLLGPSGTPPELATWLTDAGCVDVSLQLSGAMGYFRAVKADQ